MNEAQTGIGIDPGLASGGRGMVEGCVLSTYRGAMDVDLVPIIPQGFESQSYPGA